MCLLRGPAEAAWMQSVAAEMNLAETAFPLAEGDGFRLRWFTPKVEVRLCGHATLATAHILWEQGLLPAGREARFQTLSGLLTARRDGDLVELDFPARPPCRRPPDWAEAVAGALGIKPAAIVHERGGRSLRGGSTKRRCARSSPTSPPSGRSRRAASSSPAGRPRRAIDFVSRFFAPAVGVDEDPVTGSSHTVLVPYWAKKLGKSEFTAYQASARGGVLRLRLAGDRVKIAGRAVTVIKGELVV
ncbi:MAG: PhzF family phenazine biosynthesis protein [Candidatus Moduliflexus flocculans]|nr:PhzF family phenazine biosynthesis protein [Candidatus Moduliflexus flocculans]